MIDYLVLKNDESGIFGNIKRKTTNELQYVSSFRLAFFILRSAVGVMNLLLTNNLVADLQKVQLFKDILSLSKRFPMVQ